MTVVAPAPDGSIKVRPMRNCKLCKFSSSCNSLPGICNLLQYAAVVMLVGMLAYLFVTQELMV